MRNFDIDDAKKLNAAQWQIDLLALNPSYVYWGPHEDYMWKAKEGWDGRIIVPTWAEFGPWNLDDLNECVNFYFSVERASEECKTCGGDGYHPDAKHIVNGFYRHMNEVGEHWDDKITQDEVQALVDSNRLMDFTHEFKVGEGWKKSTPELVPTAEQVNAWQRGGGLGGHDAINRGILISQRCKRLGLPKTCPTCEGHGYVHTAPAAHVSLILWWLHPRKGCSRGIEITRVEQADLPAIYQFLRHAAQRNADRFGKVPVLEATGGTT